MNRDGARPAARGPTGSASRNTRDADSAPSDQARAHAGVSLYTSRESEILRQAARILHNPVDKDLSDMLIRAIGEEQSQQRAARPLLEEEVNGPHAFRHSRIRNLGAPAVQTAPEQAVNSDESLCPNVSNEELQDYTQLTPWPRSDSNVAPVYTLAPQGTAALDPFFYPSLHNSSLDESIYPHGSNEELLNYTQSTPWPRSDSNVAPVYSLASQGTTALDLFYLPLYNSNPNGSIHPDVSNDGLLGFTQFTPWPDGNVAPVYPLAQQGVPALDLFYPSLHNSNPADLTSPRRRLSSLEAHVSGPGITAEVVGNVQELDSALNSHPISTDGRSIRGKCSIPAPFCSNSLQSASDARRYSQRNGRRRSKRAKEPVGGCKPRPCRKGPLQNDQVKAAALTRKLKACMRCRFNKMTCTPDPDDPSGQCLPCKNLRRPTLARLPCFRYKITDASLYREQETPYAFFTKRWSTMEMIDIDLWQSPEIKTINITQDFRGTSYELRVREFVPQPGDLLEEVWTDNGIIKTHKIPPFAIADMGAAAITIQRFVDASTQAYIIEIAKEDPLLWDTYYMALKQLDSANTQEERDLLQVAFRLWVVARICSNPERICGEERLGIPTVTDSSSPWANGIPIPPLICAQLEIICYSQLLQPLSERTLSHLKSLVMPAKRDFWFTIYLTLFILLHSIALLTRRDEEYARQIRLPERFCNPDAIERIHNGAHVLLAHFHFINKGSKPFELVLQPDGRKRCEALAALTPDQAQFIEETAREAKARETQFRQIRDQRNFGHDFYFLSQLFDGSWESSPTVY